MEIRGVGKTSSCLAWSRVRGHDSPAANRFCHTAGLTLQRSSGSYQVTPEAGALKPDVRRKRLRCEKACRKWSDIKESMLSTYRVQARDDAGRDRGLKFLERRRANEVVSASRMGDRAGGSNSLKGPVTTCSSHLTTSQVPCAPVGIRSSGILKVKVVRIYQSIESATRAQASGCCFQQAKTHP